MKGLDLARQLPAIDGDGPATKAELRAVLEAINRILRNVNTFDPLVAHGGNVLIGRAQLDTSSVHGFLYVPRCQGTPTGVPADYGAGTPLVYDETNTILYAYDFNGAAWTAV